MRRLKPVFIFALIISQSFILPFTGRAVSNAATPPEAVVIDRFRPAACMIQIPARFADETSVDCGYLTVPRRHDQPEGPTIELAVMVIRRSSGERHPDPLIIAQGGPGGSTIDTYGELLLSNSGEMLRDRDIVLFDQRGTLYSRPSLYCTEIEKNTIDTLEKNLSSEESNRLYLEALSACRRRLASDGIDLSAFNSLENSRDIEMLRVELGYDKINLYGVSYGSLLALHYLRFFPNSLRSVILDGVLPPSTNFILNTAQTQKQSFDRLFAACAQDPDCNQRYPNLEQNFYKLIDRLEKEPAIVSLTDVERSVTYPNVVVNGETFLASIFQMMYASGLVEAIPRLIDNAGRGNFEVYSRILAIFVFDRTMSYGMYYSVLCAEDSDYSPTDQNLAGIPQEISRYESLTPERFLAACQIWDVKALDPSVDNPVRSDVPTLLLSGWFDPITPDTYAKEAASSLSNQYNFVVRTGGHGQAFSNDCADRIIIGFLNNPNTSPDTSCLEEISEPEFYTPESIVDFPIILEILNLKPLPTTAFLLILLATAFLWTSALIFPTAWIYNWAKPKTPAPVVTAAWNIDPDPIPTDTILQPKPGFLERASSWLALLAAAVSTTFIAYLLQTSIYMVLNNDYRIFYGFPGQTRAWWILPWAFLAVGCLFVWSSVKIWARSEFSIWRRLYLSLLTISTVIITLLFAYLGIFKAGF